MTNEQTAFAILINCLASLGVNAEMNETYNHDIWKAAELMGISKLDLLKSINIADSVHIEPSDTDKEKIK